MIIRRPFRLFLLAVLPLSTGLPLAGQELLEVHTAQRCIYTDGQMDEELYRFSTSEQVDAMIREIAGLGGADTTFQWIQTNVENVAAVLDGENRYLLYSLDFVERSNEIEVYGALAHEIGHHANAHTFSDERRNSEELEADQFMGYVLSKKGFSLADIGVFLKIMPSSYGVTFEERLQAVTEGFTRAERALQINSLPFDNDPKLEGLTLPGFPWPPPACNSRYELPETALAGLGTLGAVEQKLRMALDAKGYSQRSYFSVPNGFALVTQLEQYNAADASSRNDRTRWLDYPARDNFSGVMDYLKSFVVPQKGYFRLLVFIATNQPFGGGAQRVSKAQASAWLSQGFNKLPQSLAKTPLTPEYSVTVLVYEFEVPESNRKPVQKCPSTLFDAQTHLRKSGIAAGLGL